jgi:putative RNA 2'-phosphotransferase
MARAAPRKARGKGVQRMGPFLASILRHRANELGLPYTPEGFVWLADLVARFPDYFRAITVEQWREIVASDGKGRFQLNESETAIRAVQGHDASMYQPQQDGQPGMSEEASLYRMTREEVAEQRVAFHGTPEKCVASILLTGLNPGERQHVHMARRPDAEAGIRSSSDKILVINVDEVAGMGIVLYRSPNGVILADRIPPECIEEWDVDTNAPKRCSESLVGEVETGGSMPGGAIPQFELEGNEGGPGAIDLCPPGSEGGGQVIRAMVAVLLSMRRGFRLANLRAGRSRPGLGRSHVAVLRMLLALTGDSWVSEGLKVDSQVLELFPQGNDPSEEDGTHDVREVREDFDLGKGAVGLGVQAALMYVVFQGKMTAHLTIRGFTEAKNAPITVMQESLSMLIERMLPTKITFGRTTHAHWQAGRGVQRGSQELVIQPSEGELMELDLVPQEGEEGKLVLIVDVNGENSEGAKNAMLAELQRRFPQAVLEARAANTKVQGDGTLDYALVYAYTGPKSSFRHSMVVHGVEGVNWEEVDSFLEEATKQCATGCGIDEEMADQLVIFAAQSAKLYGLSHRMMVESVKKDSTRHLVTMLGIVRCMFPEVSATCTTQEDGRRLVVIEKKGV